jgi:hypothetical protein
MANRNESPDPKMRTRAYHCVTGGRPLPSPLGDVEPDDFRLEYLRDALSARGASAGFMSQFEAAHDLCSWFQALWREAQGQRNKHTSERALQRIKQVLASAATSGPDAREAVLLGVLEHLLQDRSVHPFFSDWLKHPALFEIYNEGAFLAGAEKAAKKGAQEGAKRRRRTVEGRRQGRFRRPGG